MTSSIFGAWPQTETLPLVNWAGPRGSAYDLSVPLSWADTKLVHWSLIVLKQEKAKKDKL